MDLKNRVAVITGGGRGIGRAIAIALAKGGADVVLCARTQSQINQVAEEIEALGGRALPIPVDISEEDEVNRMAEEVNAAFNHIDLLVNNAGVLYRAPIWKLDVEKWQQTIDIILKGTFLCTKAFVGKMINQGSGQIINISSTAGKKGSATRSAYCAAKFGIMGFTEALAAEVGEYGIRVNVICPGFVDTEMARDITPEEDSSKWMSADDIAQAVLFLILQPERALTAELVVNNPYRG
jgi:NAD(P)-dependent dehydrogenase (short-subunit alcohol dehydrogenase family)